MRESSRLSIVGLYVVVIVTSLAAQEGARTQQATIIAQPTPPASNQSAPDVKGWRGSEWGMTPEQVATALNRPLGEPKPDPRDGQPYYSLGEVSVGTWVADVELGFRTSPMGSGAPRTQLVHVVLGFKSPLGRPDFTSVRDELKATYGPPTSEKSGPSAWGGGLRQEANWTLPSTQITFLWLEVSSAVVMSVRFAQRVKAF
jgi:hypothetical protein